MDYVEISNSMIVYLLCGITVAIAFIQAVLYIRMAKKMTVKANIPATVPKTAFRVGLISAIGPALDGAARPAGRGRSTRSYAAKAPRCSPRSRRDRRLWKWRE